MAKGRLKHGCIFAGERSPFVAISAAMESGGQPVKRFRKELIRTGSYYKAADGLRFDVTGRHLEHWAAQFSRMKAAGVKVPVPAGHTNSPEANRGWLVDAFVEGDSLFGLVDLVGDDAIKLAGTCDVSIFSPPEFVDGRGNRYSRPIMHVALCSDPVVPGLGDFIPLAASHGQTPVNVPVFTTRPKEPMKMALNLESIQKALGLTDPLTEENAEKSIVAAFGSVTKKTAELDARITALTADLDAAKKATPIEPKPVDGELLRLSRENHELRLNKLVETAKITPAVRDKLVAAFIGADGKALELSLSNGSNVQFGRVLEALADNDPVKLGEQTRAQTLILSGGPQKSDEPLDAVAVAEMKAAAGIK